MLPIPSRVRADRIRWAAFSLLAAAALGVGGWLLAPKGPWRLALPGAALVLGPGLYALMTRRWRRRERLLAQPCPETWERILTDRVAFYNRLNAEEKTRFRNLVRIFLDETPVTGAGVEVDETTRVLVGASAAIPVFNLPGWEYDRLHEVLIRPAAFSTRLRADQSDVASALGMVGTRGLVGGLMVLSKPELEQGFAIHGDRHNVGIHEFAHLIDKGTGHVDGVPVTLPPRAFRPWVRLVREELREEARDIPEYGFTSEEEFFAVASEYFFEAPDAMREHHPDLYAHLSRIYRQDTRKRFDGLRRRIVRARSARTGRNEPCPCGSGRKYKRCCGRRRRERRAARRHA